MKKILLFMIAIILCCGSYSDAFSMGRSDSTEFIYNEKMDRDNAALRAENKRLTALLNQGNNPHLSQGASPLVSVTDKQLIIYQKGTQETNKLLLKQNSMLKTVANKLIKRNEEQGEQLRHNSDVLVQNTSAMGQLQEVFAQPKKEPKKELTPLELRKQQQREIKHGALVTLGAAVVLPFKILGRYAQASDDEERRKVRLSLVCTSGVMFATAMIAPKVLIKKLGCFAGLVSFWSGISTAISFFAMG